MEPETESGSDDLDVLMPAVYERLRSLAARWFRSQPAGATLQPTALVHEAYLHLAGRDAAPADRARFLGLAAASMRQILIQAARRRDAARRGGGWRRVELATDPAAPDAGTVDLLTLDEALTELSRLHGRQARVVEMRFFGGLTMAEIATVVGVTTRTVESDWAAARAWLESVLTDP